MTQPIPPLSARPLTSQARIKLEQDVRRAVTVATWAGCCRLCGRLIYRGARGTTRLRESPYGGICGICNRAPDHTWEAADFLAECDDVEFLSGGRPTVDQVLTRLYPEEDDGGVATVPEQTEEEIGREQQGYRRAVRNALASAVWMIYTNFETPAPPPPYEQPTDYLIDYLATYLAEADSVEQAKSMVAVIDDRLHAHLPSSVVYNITIDLVDEAAKRRRGHL